MPYYLVEEHTSGGRAEDIPFHAIVFARNARAAFTRADAQSKQTRTRRIVSIGTDIAPKYEPCEFMFEANELEEVLPNYLWVAADGSTIWYEVRLIDGLVANRLVAV